MKFFKDAYQSLYDLDWLRSKRESGFWSGFGFLLAVVFLVTVVRIGPILTFVIPDLIDSANRSFTTDVPDFTVTMQAGELSTEKLPQPFILERQIDGSNFVFMIDTVSTSTPQAGDLVKSKTDDMAIVLGKTGFNYYDPTSGQTEAENYADIPNGSLTKEYVSQWISDFRAKYLPMALVAVGFVAIIATFLLRLVVLAVWSAVFLILVKIRKINWTYVQLYKVGMYASTLPFLVSAVVFWLGWSLPAAMLTYLVLMYLVVLEPGIEASHHKKT